MENFKLASQQKLRFQTQKGILSTEQLWDLSLEDLDVLAVSLETEHKESGKKSFLAKTSAKDKTVKLKFDLVLDILTTKMEDMRAAQEAKENKEHNKIILEKIAALDDKKLESMTRKQLEAQLR